MNKIVDFKCSYDNSAGVNSEVAQRTGLKFPEAHREWESIARLSLELKKYEKSDFCELPFCHTLEGEAMGGIINLGDENIGPRAKDYLCSSMEEVLELPDIDYSRGRIAEVLKAGNFLRREGEQVILYVSGPFTILNVLADPRQVFRSFRKSPELAEQVFNKLKNEILRFVEEAQKSGIKIISYGDSVGGLNILGPKLLEQTVDMFTYPLLKEFEVTLDDDSLVTLCPKTSFALIGTGKARWKDIDLGGSMRYSKACMSISGKAKFAGQMCIKNRGFELKNGIIKTVQLL
ncbi:methylcobalamin:coenzyme M methyltransferase [Andreesenia angusta]|uniref:Methylcobalamin:coenzyme M methyltransferase n=1 Tax=Andreesenia angusta TaxID=39480 RepID=A0A1S1V8E6_9FIRM|nr:uroporphyrinogen decarboxylase family protein [Andreesenia angusta]OHW62873.1 methylcobalamin:coenzyme M methyltransferase [Andreesenia angusta]